MWPTQLLPPLFPPHPACQVSKDGPLVCKFRLEGVVGESVASSKVGFMELTSGHHAWWGSSGNGGGEGEGGNRLGRMGGSCLYILIEGISAL